MSTKGTILNTPDCHIYHDYANQHTCKTDIDRDKEVLVIEVSYGFIDYEEYEDQSVIVVEWDSDFAKMVTWMCEQYKAAHDKVEDVDIDGQPEPLKSVLNGLTGAGNEVRMINGVLTIKAK